MRDTDRLFVFDYVVAAVVAAVVGDGSGGVLA